MHTRGSLGKSTFPNGLCDVAGSFTGHFLIWSMTPPPSETVGESIDLAGLRAVVILDEALVRSPAELFSLVKAICELCV